MRGTALYIDADTPLHRCDARVKIVALLAFSVALVAVPGWPFLLASTCAAALAVAVARIPLGVLNRMLAPVYVMAAFAFAFNVLAQPGGVGALAGAFFAVRMVVLVGVSFVVCLTSASSELLDAFAWFLTPLRRMRVPVDDIALTLALSVRFIPVIEREFWQIRAAQVARGGEASGSFRRVLEVWGSAFSALFVGLFRHAEALSQAMDARCYGAAGERSHLGK